MKKLTIILDSWGHNELEDYLLSLNGILDVTIKIEEVLEIYIQYDFTLITPKIIKYEILLFLDILKMPSILAFDKHSDVKTLEYKILRRLAYYPITSDYIQRLINFSEVLDVLKPLENDIIVYRGCSTLERNGVNGIVSTTVDERIAEQFSRGTILKIHVPKGTKYIDICSIRPKE